MAPRRKLTQKSVEQVPTSIAFDYIKGNHFRVIHADGAIGGITPSGFIHMALFNERNAIPRQIRFELDGSKIGQEIARDSRDSIVRELEADVFMGEAAARSLCDWLTGKLNDLDEHRKAIEKMSKKKRPKRKKASK